MAVAFEPSDLRYVAWFHELDAWTEYWDVYHPETRGRYYFGDGSTEPGLLSVLLPRTTYPPAFTAWTRLALGTGAPDAFLSAVRDPDVTAAVREVDDLVAQIFARHFGDPAAASTRRDYLEATFRFAIDALPPAPERAARIPPGDPRHRTAGRHTLDGDIMWFAWALQLDAARAVSAGDDLGAINRHALMMAGIATGCAANYAWRAHRRTRASYDASPATYAVLRDRGLAWSTDFAAASAEVHALYRIREWGDA